MSTPHVTVRPAMPDDLGAISEIHARARASYYAGHIPAEEYSGPAELERQREGTANAIASDAHIVLCAVRDERVVGFAVLAARQDEDKLFHFHIDPSVWRTGTGTALHHACVAAWQNAGLAKARLEVFAPNARARAFYVDQGWEEDGRVDDHVRMVLRVPATATATVRPGGAE